MFCVKDAVVSMEERQLGRQARHWIGEDVGCWRMASVLG